MSQPITQENPEMGEQATTGRRITDEHIRRMRETMANIGVALGDDDEIREGHARMMRRLRAAV